MGRLPTCSICAQYAVSTPAAAAASFAAHALVVTKHRSKSLSQMARCSHLRVSSCTATMLPNRQCILDSCTRSLLSGSCLVLQKAKLFLERHSAPVYRLCVISRSALSCVLHSRVGSPGQHSFSSGVWCPQHQLTIFLKLCCGG